MSTESDKKRRFDRLVRQYATDLYRYGLWLCNDATQANDLVQETFMRAWRALDSLKEEKAVKGWLITILRREHARTFERKVPPMTDVDEVIVADEAGQSPESAAEVALLRREIAKLPAKYREPLLLQVIGGYSCEEIARQLGVSKSAVMTQLFRAREKLKTALIAGDDLTSNVHELS
ncbi:MAG: sigma-70 family RNA polymerase sigma factor [Wenzhouxiangellaceae bacterium]